jgi:hypothetical protein
MRREKGKAVERWNWQAHENKHGAESDISSEYDIISNYHPSDSSNDESINNIDNHPPTIFFNHNQPAKRHTTRRTSK